MPVPVTEFPTGLTDHRNERGRVPGRHDVVDHELRTSRRDEEIAVAVAPRSRDRSVLGNRAPACVTLRLANESW